MASSVERWGSSFGARWILVICSLSCLIVPSISSVLFLR
jgi:hypothetical protein